MGQSQARIGVLSSVAYDSGSGLTVLDEVRSFSPNNETGTVDATALNAGYFRRMKPTLRTASVDLELNYLADEYAVAAQNILAAWQATIAANWKFTWIEDSNLDTWAADGFPTSLSIQCGAADELVTARMTLQMTQDSTGVLWTYASTGGTADTAAASNASSGTNWVLGMEDDAGDGVVEIAEIRGFSLDLTREAVEATHLRSGYIRDYKPGMADGTMSFDVNWLSGAVADLASHGAQSGTAAQPSLLVNLDEREEVAFKILWSNAPGAAGPLYQRWSFTGFLTGLNPTVNPDSLIQGRCALQMTSDITVDTAATVGA